VIRAGGNQEELNVVEPDRDIEKPTSRTPSSPRDALMREWRAARTRRDAAELGGEAYRAACEDIARVEIEIARVERAMDPPRV
jgi:hypothetical protein